MLGNVTSIERSQLIKPRRQIWECTEWPEHLRSRRSLALLVRRLRPVPKQIIKNPKIRSLTGRNSMGQAQ